MRSRTQLVLASPGALLLALFFALPVLAVAVDALREGGAAFAHVFGTSGFWAALGGSAALTLVAATLSTLVGVAVALYLSRLTPHPRTALSCRVRRRKHRRRALHADGTCLRIVVLPDPAGCDRHTAGAGELRSRATRR